MLVTLSVAILKNNKNFYVNRKQEVKSQKNQVLQFLSKKDTTNSIVLFSI